MEIKAGKRAVEPSAADAGERKFLLPDCIAMGFLIPDDAQIIADMKRKKELNDKLKKL